MASTMSEYQAKMQKIFDYLGGRCVKCGCVEDLHVDHINHLTKSFTIGENWSRSWDILEAELKKCQLLCKEHHLEKSKEEGSLAKGWNKQPRQTHGTVWSYSKYKCRCDLCKDVKSKAMKQQYEKKQGIAQPG